jgi:hypothetical protein
MEEKMSIDNLRGVWFIAQEGHFSHEQYAREHGSGPALKWGDCFFADDAADYITFIQGMTKQSDEFEVTENDGIIELTVKNSLGSVSKSIFLLVVDKDREELLNVLRNLKGTGERLLMLAGI